MTEHETGDPVQSAIAFLTAEGYVVRDWSAELEHQEAVTSLADQASVQIVVATSDYRGDHGADVLIAVAYDGQESVGDLLERLLKAGTLNPVHGDHVQLRLPIDPQPKEQLSEIFPPL